MADLDIGAELLQAVKNGIGKAVTEKMSGYNSPLDKLLGTVVSDQSSAIGKLLTDSIQSALKDETFREHIASAVRTKLAGTLIQRFGGEMEKQVNALKSDPTTRARITLAIEEIVKQHSAA